MFLSGISGSGVGRSVIELSLSGRMLRVVVWRRRGVKRLILRVVDGVLRVTAPVSASDAEVVSFVESRSAWVISRLAEESRLYDRVHPSVFYRGELTRLCIDGLYAGRLSGVRHERHAGVGHLVFECGSSGVGPARILERHLRGEAESLIRSSLSEVLSLLGESDVSIGLRDQRSRWGSCSSRRHLSFNWRLAMAPREVLHYVVVHEAAHLRHADHGAGFWSLVGELLPDWRLRRDWLRLHQSALLVRLDRVCEGLPVRGEVVSRHGDE